MPLDAHLPPPDSASFRSPQPQPLTQPLAGSWVPHPQPLEGAGLGSTSPRPIHVLILSDWFLPFRLSTVDCRPLLRPPAPLPRPLKIYTLRHPSLIQSKERSCPPPTPPPTLPTAPSNATASPSPACSTHLANSSSASGPTPTTFGAGGDPKAVPSASAIWICAPAAN